MSRDGQRRPAVVRRGGTRQAGVRRGGVRRGASWSPRDIAASAFAFTEETPLEHGFAHAFRDRIVPILRRQETQRQVMRRKALIGIGVSALAGAGAAAGGACTTVVAGQATQVADAGLGVTLDIPADAVTDAGGNPYGGQVCVADTAPELVAQILPPLISPCKLITIHPFGLTFAPAGTMTFPNSDNLPAGAQVDIWFLAQGSGTWTIAGQGQVDAGGTTVTSVAPNITGAGNVFAVPPLPLPVVATDHNDFNHRSTALADGNFSTSYSTVSYRSLGQDRNQRLVYNSSGADPRPIIASEITIPGTLPALIEGRLEVAGIQVAGPVYTSTSLALDPADPGLMPGEAIRQALQFDAGEFPTGSYPYRYVVTAQYACSKVGAEVGRDVLVTNNVQSPFGAGWTLDELHGQNGII